MSLTPKNQRFPYDEEGKIIESATTMYQIAEKRVKKIREEDFFLGMERLMIFLLFLRK